MATRTARKPDPGLYVANTTGVIRVDGVIYRYTRGKTIVKKGNPLLRALPGRFSPMDITGPEVVAL